MANWAEGVFKVRGTRDNILKYLNELLQVPVSFIGEDKGKVLFDVESDGEYVFSIQSEDCFYLKGTRRAFIENVVINFYLDEYCENIVSINNFKQAWAVVPENYTHLSKKYNVDIHIFAYEFGIEFTQEVEIHSGELCKNETKEYGNYHWDVPFSNLGG